MILHKYKLFIIITLVSVISLWCVSILLNTVKGQEEQAFTAILSGKNEVTPTKPNSAGLATFQLNDNTSQISYWLNISGIKKINQALIHIGTIGQNGDAVVNLTKERSAKGDGTAAMILTSGNITKTDLEGPLKDKAISDLVNLMSNGSTYVNIYSDKYPKGAIRGQINFAVIEPGGGLASSSTRTGETSGVSSSTGTAAPNTGIGGTSGGGDSPSIGTVSPSTGGGGTSAGVGGASSSAGTQGNTSTNSSSPFPSTGSEGNTSANTGTSSTSATPDSNQSTDSHNTDAAGS